MTAIMEMPDKRNATADALDALCRADADLGRALAVAGPLPDRRRRPGFAALTKIVVQQQLSLASAAAIWGRLEEAVSPFTPENLLALAEPDLRRVGLSRQKAAYCHNLARAVAEGTVDMAGLETLDDEAAIAHLCRVKGIGPWTAEIYLLFALDRADVWPAGDLALQIAAQQLKSLPERPAGRAFIDMAEPWRPWRGTAARLLWHYYRAVRMREAGVGQ